MVKIREVMNDIRADLSWFAHVLEVPVENQLRYCARLNASLTQILYIKLVEHAIALSQIRQGDLTLKEVSSHRVYVGPSFDKLTFDTKRLGFYQLYDSVMRKVFARGDIPEILMKIPTRFHLRLLDILYHEHMDTKSRRACRKMMAEICPTAIEVEETVWHLCAKDLVRASEKDAATVRVAHLRRKSCALMTRRDLGFVIVALMYNTSIEALDIQAAEEVITDVEMELIISLIKSNRNIWLLSLGRCSCVRVEMWEAFAEALQLTNVTHLDPRRERCVPAGLKRKIKLALYANRSKHYSYADPSNKIVLAYVNSLQTNGQKLDGCVVENLEETEREPTQESTKIVTGKSKPRSRSRSKAKPKSKAKSKSRTKSKSMGVREDEELEPSEESLPASKRRRTLTSLRSYNEPAKQMTAQADLRVGRMVVYMDKSEKRVGEIRELKKGKGGSGLGQVSVQLYKSSSPEAWSPSRWKFHPGWATRRGNVVYTKSEPNLEALSSKVSIKDVVFCFTELSRNGTLPLDVAALFLPGSS